MPPTRSPNLLRRLAEAIGVVRPRELSAYAIVSDDKHGRVMVTPRFTLDGEDVPAQLVRNETEQNVMGHRVRLTVAAARLLQDFGASPDVLSKRSAGPRLLSLQSSGLQLRNTDGRPYVAATTRYEGDVAFADRDSLQARLDLVTPDGKVVPPPKDARQMRAEEGWYTSPNGIYRAPTTTVDLDQQLVDATHGYRLTGDAAPEFLADLRQAPSAVGSFVFDPEVAKSEIFDRSNFKSGHMRVDGDADWAKIQPGLEYEGRRSKHVEPIDLAQRARRQGQGYRRVEDGWVRVNDGLAEEVANQAAPYVRATKQPSVATGEEIPALISRLGRDSAWHVYMTQPVKDAHRVIDEPARPRFLLDVHHGPRRSMLELSPVYDHERFTLTHDEVRDTLDAGKEWVRRSKTWIRVDSAKVEKVDKAIVNEKLERGDGRFRFSASRRHNVVEVFSRLGTIEHTASYNEFLAKLADFTRIEDSPLPSGLPPSLRLRSYQKHGFNWLMFLRRFDLNGVLADDMGLGKTIQTLAAILAAREGEGARLPSLVVCPASVVRNWRDEALTKFPGLFSPMVLDGTPRTRKGLIARVGLDHDLVVTSYAIAHNDFGELQGLPWHYVIFDEAHTLKNPSAKRTQTLKAIPGARKLALTGTPVQNRLLELWSLFDVLMPGYLGKRADFSRKYEGKTKASAELKERIYPFVLRRLKSTVATDLPEKTITTRTAELSSIQVQLYREVASGELRELERQVDRVGVSGAATYVIQLYTRLRGLCNHPVLAGHLGPPEVKDSGKLELLQEVLEEVAEGEHKALLFCQSTQMLDIIESYARRWGHDALRLDGSTPPAARADLVERFQRDEGLRLFLISTKAGGTGLNLTAADVVIFFDHDWNPANDQQAMDRAYRIGQTKRVTVIRLVSLGTIEEKILERQALKRQLADAVIGNDELGFKDLSKAELLRLFEYAPPESQ
jgi:superfamily II DNA or RNA helicase